MKLHVSMKVEDIHSATAFYSRLFNQEPVIVKDDYVKWDVDDPAVNFVIEPGQDRTGLDHLGIQVESPKQLESLAGRMRDSDQPFLDVEKTHCCYARMDKAWVKGAAAEKWEAFLTHSHDDQTYGEDRERQLDTM